VILLDTHALVWWVSQTGGLSGPAQAAIAASGADILVSSITAWEIAMLAQRGRIGLAMDVAGWLAEVGKIPGLKFIPVDNAIAVDAVTLPGEFHKDPVDRIIVATARKFTASLITADEKISAYQHVRTIW
jgi:PIN domain nuclease of toxin-antitoxin system